MTLYRFVDAQKAEGFPVRLTCSVVGVSPSAYYASKQRPRSGPAQLAEAALVDEIRTIWRQSGGTYGSPRVCAELRRRGRVVNHKRVERLMKGHRMAGFVPRKRRVTTTADTAHRIPDLLAGDFGATRPDEAWVGDITYIRTRQGFLYLAFVLDLASRRVVGVSMASHMKASLVADALREAIGTRGGQVRGVVFHTDRGPLNLGNIRRGPPPSSAGHMASHSRWGRTGVCLGQRRRRVVFSAPSRRNSSTETTTRAATTPAYQSGTGSKPGTTPAGSTPPSGTSHQTNGRTTTTITQPHKPSVQHMGGTPLVGRRMIDHHRRLAPGARTRPTRRTKPPVAYLANECRVALFVTQAPHFVEQHRRPHMGIIHQTLPNIGLDHPERIRIGSHPQARHPFARQMRPHRSSVSPHMTGNSRNRPSPLPQSMNFHVFLLCQHQGQGSSPRCQLLAVSSLERTPPNLRYLPSRGGEFQ